MDDLPQFEDPALKAAIRDAMSREQAPRELRDRIAESLRADSRPISRRIIVLGMAACILLGIGLSVLILWPANEKPAPNWFADAMIATHDQCKSLADHHRVKDVVDTDQAALQTKYREMLGHPALIAMLDDGWQFKGAGVCEIAKVPAAHLFFTRGDETISVFSVTSRLLYQSSSTRDATYAQTQNGYQIAGFTAAGAVHCLVAHSPRGNLTLRQIIRLRDRLKKGSKDLVS